jgi:hypothetical protein
MRPSARRKSERTRILVLAGAPHTHGAGHRHNTSATKHSTAAARGAGSSASTLRGRPQQGGCRPTSRPCPRRRKRCCRRWACHTSLRATTQRWTRSSRWPPASARACGPATQERARVCVHVRVCVSPCPAALSAPHCPGVQQRHAAAAPLTWCVAAAGYVLRDGGALKSSTHAQHAWDSEAVSGRHAHEDTPLQQPCRSLWACGTHHTYVHC